VTQAVAAARCIVLDLPLRTPLLNKWQRMHWSQRKKRGEAISWAIRLQIGPLPDQPMRKCKVHVERESPVAPDVDGLYGSCKPLLDALVPLGKPDKNGRRRHPYGLGVIADDNPDCITELVVKHVKGPRHRTVVTIQEVL
jgi:hypothetical protein